MITKVKIFTLFLALTYIITPAQKAAVVDINNFYLPFNNKGILADVNFGPSGSLAKYPGPYGKGLIFSAGFYLSGYKNDELFANAVISSVLVEDFIPGNVDTTKNVSPNIVYTIRRDDPLFGEAWQNWKHAVNKGAYFYDGDGNGIYNPTDNNKNGIWEENEDRPDLLYDVTYFTVYNDGLPKEMRRWSTVEPIGIEIRQTIFASGSIPELQDVIFIRYSIIYKGLSKPAEPDSLNDVIFSVTTDMDIGNPSDDLVGCDTSIHSAFGYNNGPDVWFNPDRAWGDNPPAIFRTILQGPPVKTNSQNDTAYNRMGQALGEKTFKGKRNGDFASYMHFLGGFALLGDPNDAQSARNQALGLTTNGFTTDPCDWAFSEVRGSANCKEINPYFWYSGDPVTDYGWICTASRNQFDVISTEKFTLIKNEPMDIIVAYTVGHGSDALNSITNGRQKVKKIIEIYEQNFPGSFTPPNYEEIYPKNYTLSQNYPNPFNPNTTIEYSIPNGGTSYDLSQQRTSITVYDILGREVKTLVNEMKAPGNYEVNFNASQLASGVYFYRLESGSFIQTKKMMVLK